MAFKAYACPRCLTLSSETEDGDGGGFHTCTPSPLVHGLESRIAELEAWAFKVLNETPGKDLPGDLDITILDPRP
jgi:hypothetical protein